MSTEHPPVIYVKINLDGSLGRAYIPDHINHDSTPPDGVEYVKYELPRSTPEDLVS